MVVLGPYDWPLGADVEELIRDAVEGAMPDISVSPTSFDVILNPGTSTVEPMTLDNLGDATLNFSIRDEGTSCPSPMAFDDVGPDSGGQGALQDSFTLPRGNSANAGVRLSAATGSSALRRIRPDPPGEITIISEEKFTSFGGSNRARGGKKTAVKASYLYDAMSTGPSILLYGDDTSAGPGTTYVDQALQALGLSYTGYYGDYDGFGAALLTGSWDLVVVSHNNWYALGNWWSEIEDYVNGGGKVVIATFDMDGSHSEATTLWATLGVSYFADMSVPQPVYWWDAGHPVFSVPESVPQFTSMSNKYIDDGDRADATASSVAVGGFTASPGANQGAIFVGGSGIVNSFLLCENDANLDSDGKLDAVELWMDEILYTLDSDASWLWEDPAGGTVGISSSQVVDVHFDAAGLATGSTHCAEVIIHNNDHRHPAVSVPARLRVNAPPDISGVPDVIVDHTTSLPVAIDLWAYASDFPTPDSGLTYTIEGSPPAGAGVSIVDNRWLIIDPSTSWCGYTDVTLRVTDPGGLWDNDRFRVAVTWSCQG
jgi:hypothetical protein